MIGSDGVLALFEVLIFFGTGQQRQYVAATASRQIQSQQKGTQTMDLHMVTQPTENQMNNTQEFVYPVPVTASSLSRSTVKCKSRISFFRATSGINEHVMYLKFRASAPKYDCMFCRAKNVFSLFVNKSQAIWFGVFFLVLYTCITSICLLGVKVKSSQKPLK